MTKSIELSDGSCAFVIAQTALLNCRVAGMLAENQHRANCGNSVAYASEEFFAVEREFEAMIGSNEILAMAQK